MNAKPIAKKVGFDQAMQQEAQCGCGQKRRGQVDEHSQSLCIPARDAQAHLFHSLHVKPQHRNYGTRLNTYGVGVCSRFVLLRGWMGVPCFRADLHDALSQEQMAGGADGQIFRHPLHDSEDGSLKIRHSLRGTLSWAGAVHGQQAIGRANCDEEER